MVMVMISSWGLVIERKAVNAVQVCESGVVLEEIPFNLSDSIILHISAENERIDGCIREWEDFIQSSLIISYSSWSWERFWKTFDSMEEISLLYRYLQIRINMMRAEDFGDVEWRKRFELKRGIEFWNNCRQPMGMVIVVMVIYSDVYDDDDYGLGFVWWWGEFNYRGHGGDGHDVLMMTVISWGLILHMCDGVYCRTRLKQRCIQRWQNKSWTRTSH